MLKATVRSPVSLLLMDRASLALIVWMIFAELPPKVEYFLTDIGKTALPVIVTLGRWGENHQDHLRDKIGKGECLGR
ncbi:MAG TPA: winged helix-turn-helix transcriptional regulator [Pyrinomonadaceae bacterium]